MWTVNVDCSCVSCLNCVRSRAHFRFKVVLHGPHCRRRNCLFLVFFKLRRWLRFVLEIHGTDVACGAASCNVVCSRFRELTRCISPRRSCTFVQSCVWPIPRSSWIHSEFFIKVSCRCFSYLRIFKNKVLLLLWGCLLACAAIYQLLWSGAFGLIEVISSASAPLLLHLLLIHVDVSLRPVWQKLRIWWVFWFLG